MSRSWLLMIVLAWPSAACLAAPPLGRLFLTPDERQPLRQTPEIQALPASSQAITVNGIVTPSHGTQSVWINQQVLTQAPSATHTVHIAGAAPLAIKLKPGQSFQPLNGSLSASISEAYLTQRPAPPKHPQGISPAALKPVAPSLTLPRPTPRRPDTR